MRRRFNSKGRAGESAPEENDTNWKNLNQHGKVQSFIA